MRSVYLIVFGGACLGMASSAIAQVKPESPCMDVIYFEASRTDIGSGVPAARSQPGYGFDYNEKKWESAACAAFTSQAVADYPRRYPSTNIANDPKYQNLSADLSKVKTSYDAHMAAFQATTAEATRLQQLYNDSQTWPEYRAALPGYPALVERHKTSKAAAQANYDAYRTNYASLYPASYDWERGGDQ